MPLGIAQVADVFVDVADTLVDDFDLIEFVQGLARHAADLSDQAAAAGVMISGQDGSLHHVGASSEDARMLELFQIQNAEGPCLDSFRTGQPVVIPDLTQLDSRWPSFSQRALSLGIRSVHAYPMRLRSRTIGGLNVFQTRRHEPVAQEARVLQALADVATIAIIQEQAVSRAEVLTEQLQAALNSRIVVEQAKGAIARTFSVSVDDAFELLRAHSRRNRRRLTELAHDVVTSDEGPELLRPR